MEKPLMIFYYDHNKMTAFGGTPWKQFFLYDRDTETTIWTMEGPFTSDTMAGLAIIGKILLEAIDPRTQLFFKGHKENIPTNVPYFDMMIDRQYIILSNVEDFNLRKYKDIRPNPGTIGIWILSFRNKETPDFKYWHFVEVEHIDEFMQGFITMCEAFGVDFTDYLLKFPFDSNGMEYDIPGYELKEKIMMRE